MNRNDGLHPDTNVDLRSQAEAKAERHAHERAMEAAAAQQCTLLGEIRDLLLSPQPTVPRMWTADEVADHFRVHVNTISRWVAEGIITPCRLSTQTLTGRGSSRKRSPARALFDPRDFDAIVTALKQRNLSSRASDGHAARSVLDAMNRPPRRT
jgi:hypothetical protein